MGKFKYSVFVKIKDSELRKETILFLADLRNKDLLFSARINMGFIIWSNADFVGTTDNKNGLNEYINCGTNISLFKALAACNDTNDYMQWFVSDCNKAWVNQGIYAPIGSFELCLLKDRYMGQNSDFCNTISPAHKATKEEIIKQFKNRINEKSRRRRTN